MNINTRHLTAGQIDVLSPLIIRASRWNVYFFAALLVELVSSQTVLKVTGSLILTFAFLAVSGWYLGKAAMAADVERVIGKWLDEVER